VKLKWRPISDEWATLQLQIGIRQGVDATLRDLMWLPSQNAKVDGMRFE